MLIEQQQRTHSQRLSYSDRFGRHMVRARVRVGIRVRVGERYIECCRVHCIVQWLVHHVCCCLAHLVRRPPSPPPPPPPTLSPNLPPTHKLFLLHAPPPLRLNPPRPTPSDGRRSSCLTKAAPCCAKPRTAFASPTPPGDPSPNPNPNPDPNLNPHPALTLNPYPRP